MAVLPLNAVAAAMGVSCSALHAGTQVNVAAAVPADAAGVPVAAIDHSAHHGDSQAAPAQEEAGSDATSASGHTTCSACSAFCIGAVAPPPALMAAHPTNGSEIVLISPSPWLAGYIPDGHKRPPRHIFA